MSDAPILELRGISKSFPGLKMLDGDFQRPQYDAAITFVDRNAGAFAALDQPGHPFRRPGGTDRHHQQPRHDLQHHAHLRPRPVEHAKPAERTIARVR